MTSALLWQIALVDGLLLGLTVGLGLWFRAWLRREKGEMDIRLNRLEAQQAHLERLGGRLQAVCRSLELIERAGGGRGEERGAERKVAPKKGDTRDGPDPDLEAREEDVYDRAWHLLASGATPSEVARKLGMGIAEVELMGRMLRHRRQG